MDQIELWPSFRFQTAVVRASISSQVLYNASEVRTVLSTPKRRKDRLWVHAGTERLQALEFYNRFRRLHVHLTLTSARWF